jgi:hypothetical protein
MLPAIHSTPDLPAKALSNEVAAEGETAGFAHRRLGLSSFTNNNYMKEPFYACT